MEVSSRNRAPHILIWDLGRWIGEHGSKAFSMNWAGGRVLISRKHSSALFHHLLLTQYNWAICWIEISTFF